MDPPDTIAPLTKEYHYTEPIQTEKTQLGIDRFCHRVPLAWFLVVSGEIDAWSYEHFLDNKNLFEMDYSVVAVAFDYDVDRNPDGTGKPFHILFCDSVGGKRKCHPRTHYLLRLLKYDEDTYEVVAANPTDEHDGYSLLSKNNYHTSLIPVMTLWESQTSRESKYGRKCSRLRV